MVRVNESRLSGLSVYMIRLFLSFIFIFYTIIYLVWCCAVRTFCTILIIMLMCAAVQVPLSFFIVSKAIIEYSNWEHQPNAKRKQNKNNTHRHAYKKRIWSFFARSHWPIKIRTKQYPFIIWHRKKKYEKTPFFIISGFCVIYFAFIFICCIYTLHNQNEISESCMERKWFRMEC